MSLSVNCIKRRAVENTIARKWLTRGLFIGVGTHLGLLPLMASIPTDAIAPPERIALVVTESANPIEANKVTGETAEKAPAEASIEAPTGTIAQAEFAAETQTSGGLSAAPPPIASFQPVPTEAISESAFDPTEALSESEPVVEESVDAGLNLSEDVSKDTDELSSDSSESENAENSTEPIETATNNAAETNNTNFNALRERIRRIRESRRNTRDTRDARNTRDIGDGSTVEPSVPTGTNSDVARREGLSEGSGSGTAAGDGDGNSSGSSTVSCRRCDRPVYPEDALADGVEGTPAVRLEYDEDGRVVDVVLEQSSGNTALDQAVLEAAQNYEFDSGGQSGSVSIDIDFGIEGSARSRAAQQRGEIESVTTPAPESEVVREPAPESTTPVSESANNPPAESIPDTAPAVPAQEEGQPTELFSSEPDATPDTAPAAELRAPTPELDTAPAAQEEASATELAPAVEPVPASEPEPAPVSEFIPAPTLAPESAPVISEPALESLPPVSGTNTAPALEPEPESISDVDSLE